MKKSTFVSWMTMAIFIGLLVLTGQVIASPRTARLSEQVQALDFSKAVPGQLSYQGFLIDSEDSSAVTATLEMTFRLFDSESKGAQLWSETHPSVDVSGGLFHVQLGSVTAFPDGLFDGSTLWLQTEVGAEALSPRKPLASVAYSQRAADADHALTAQWSDQAQHAAHADTADVSLMGVVTLADSAAVSGNAYHLEGQNLADLDNRYVDENDLDHLDAADGDPAGAVHVDENGKVGIGTTSPLTELDVAGSVNATTYFGDGSNLTGISGVADTDWTISGSDMYAGVSGNVGIGLSSPDYKLHIIDDANHVLRLGTLHANSHINITANPSGAGGLQLRVDGGNNHIAFLTAGSEKARLTSDGELGIGTTAPTAPLTIQTISGPDILFASSGNNADIVSDGELRIGTSATQNLHMLTNSNYRVAVTGGGNVGIGTTTPGTKLEVNYDNDSPATPAIAINNSDPNGQDALDFQFAGTTRARLRVAALGGFHIGTVTSGDLNLWTSNTVRLHITNDGKVGIGTTSPARALQVAGDVEAASYYGDGSHLTGISGTTDNDWTIAGSDVYHQTGNVGIGTASPSYPLHVYNYAGYSPALAGYFNAVGHEYTGTAHAVYAVASADDEIAYGIYSTASSTFNSAYAGYFDNGNVVVANGRLGIGTTTPARTLHVDAVMRLEPTTAPSSPAEGDIYMDGATHKLMVYDGTTWRACW